MLTDADLHLQKFSDLSFEDRWGVQKAGITALVLSRGCTLESLGGAFKMPVPELHPKLH